MGKQQNLSSLANALRLLKLFSVEKPEFGINELAEALGIANSTAHRLISTLAEQDFVTKDHVTNLYRLSVSILSFQPVITSNIKLFQLSAPILESLNEQTKETALVSILFDHQAYCLNKADKHMHFFTYVTHIGSTAPLHASATGHVLLAYQDEEKIDEYMGRFMEDWADQEKTHYKQYLKQVRKEGYALSVNRLYPGITDIAAPVRDKTDQVVAAIGIVGPSQRIEKEKQLKAISQVKAAANKLYAQLTSF